MNTKKNQHTPGPWQLVKLSEDASVIEATPGGFICSTEGHSCIDQEADARLISAAPDLLAHVAILEKLGYSVTWGNDVVVISEGK